MALMVGGFLPYLDWDLLLVGYLFSLLLSILIFTIEFTIGLATFWLEETWVMRYVFNIFTTLLSGAFIPLEFFPRALQVALAYTPFPLIASAPIHLFMGSSQYSLVYLFSVLLIWIVLLGIIARIIWRKGIGLYTAAGI
jgi:ABC-2 type transport system permease protein